MLRRKIKKICLACIVLFTIVTIFFIDNKNVQYENIKIKEDFSLKIMHLSDLHFPKIKVDINKLVTEISGENPDLLVITGDLLDRSSKAENSKAYEFLEKIKDIAPIFYIEGNHELSNPKEAKNLRLKLEEIKAFILINQHQELVINNKNIAIIGYYNNFLNIELADDCYKIVLAHHPENWEKYLANLNFKPDLILSGHAHGGQFRIFDQGFFSPGQGFLPEYTSSLYELNDETKMIVSRGLGNSIFPFRVNNKPHLPVINILKEN